MDLDVIAVKAGWASPNVPNGGQGLPKGAVFEYGTVTRPDGRKVQLKLGQQVRLATAGWPTPNAYVALDASLVDWDLFPLAEPQKGRVGLLRGSGNAIVPQVAALFIEESTAAWEEENRRNP